MIDRVKFNIDDEYVLHICSGCWKKYRIYKSKEWTDATGYYEAHSDDGKIWCFGSQSSLNPIEESSIDKVVDHLKYLNRNKHYKQLICMNCAGSSEKATNFKKIPYNTIEGLEQLED